MHLLSWVLKLRRKEKILFMLKENQIAKLVVDAAYNVHTKLGPGLLESVYELEKRKLSIKRQCPIAIHYNGLVLDEGFKADIIVEDLVIIELKSVEAIAPVHKKQLLTYLRLSDKRLGLLINFGAHLIKNGIFRIVNGLEE